MGDKHFFMFFSRIRLHAAISTDVYIIIISIIILYRYIIYNVVFFSLPILPIPIQFLIRVVNSR